MNKIPLKLGAQFTLIAIAALLAAVCVFACIVSFGGNLVKDKVEKREYVEQTIQKKVDEFQSYVTKNNIASTDADSIKEWVDNERNVVLSVYADGRMVFDSTSFQHPDHGREEGQPWRHRTLYSVSFADKRADIELFALLGFKAITLINYGAIAAAFCVFILIYTTFIRRKIKYITSIEKEVNILESGDLSYKMTLKGNDELTYLARSIDNMRLSINERQAEEERARSANHKLVTAMSHDLRTPLTILLGFLEIIDGKKYGSSEELEDYIKKAKNKAFQIKELSDRIFEYFFAFNMEESELNREYYGIEVISNMIEDYIFSLNEKGFKVEYESCNQPGRVYIDPDVFHRVFDNIFSNILKYADKTKPVVINAKGENQCLSVELSNAVLPLEHKEESTNIGLQVCKNIVQQHNGEFYTIENEGRFTAVVKLRLKK